MSDPLKIAFVVEGPTDFIMLKAVIANLLTGRDFIPQILKPEMSEAFKIVPGEDSGWPGVCRWCFQTKDQGSGKLSDSPIFLFHDLMVFQLDADVAGVSYSSGHIEDPFPFYTLPCEKPCPPAAATTDRLRAVVLQWMGETVTPSQMVFCIPSKALETWVLVGLFPDDSVARRRNVECYRSPASTLQGKPLNRRLVRSGQKDVEMYQQLAHEFANSWPTIVARCSEAARFGNEFLQAVGQISEP